MLKTISKLTSHIFNYYTWITIVLIASIFRVGLKTEHVKTTFILLIIFDVIGPILTYLFLLNAGKITDASLIKRQDRPLLFGVTTFLVMLGTIISYFLGNDLFIKIHILIFIFMLTLFLVTMFFKMSGHAFLNTYFIFILNFLFGWNLLWLFSIVAIVGFARLYLKAHIPTEVAAGIFIGLVEPYLILKFFKLL